MPSTGSPGIGPEVWVAKLNELGHPASVDRAGTDECSIEIVTIRVRGFALYEGPFLEAIHFEFHASDDSDAFSVIQSVSESLGWELHPYEDDDEN